MNYVNFDSWLSMNTFFELESKFDTSCSESSIHDKHGPFVRKRWPVAMKSRIVLCSVAKIFLLHFIYVVGNPDRRCMPPTQLIAWSVIHIYWRHYIIVIPWALPLHTTLYRLQTGNRSSLKTCFMSLVQMVTVYF